MSGYPHVDKPESETRSSSPVSRRTGYGTRVFEAVVGASVHQGLGFFLWTEFRVSRKRDQLLEALDYCLWSYFLRSLYFAVCLRCGLAPFWESTGLNMVRYGTLLE